MKKIYEEPMIVVEQYALTQNVANCSIKVGSNDNACIFSDPDVPSQYKDFINAGFPAEGMDGTDGICYHTNAGTMFSS